MSDNTAHAWEAFIDQLKPLGQRLQERVPARLRNDPLIVQESWRLLLYGLVRATTDAIIGDPRYPIFVPELHIAQNIFQPNADTIYKTAMIDGNGTYRIKGDRGTVRMFVLAQLGPDTLRTGKPAPALLQYDFDTLTQDENGNFDVLISRERPAGYAGDWWELHPQAVKFMVRIVGCRWGEEREPSIGIDRLDVPPAKGRQSLEDLAARLQDIPLLAGNAACFFPDHVEQLREQGYINSLKIVDFSNMTGLSRQSYYEGAYEIDDDEALILEVKIPSEVAYWSLILTNEIYETTDWYNNQSSLNDTQARLDEDGSFRAVISRRDPGIANWLDTTGYGKGAIQGRWFGSDEKPTPSLRKVKFSEVFANLPAGTKTVTVSEREAAIRARRLNAQKRTIW